MTAIATGAPASDEEEAGVLVLDAHTLRDLEIFQAEGNQQSLFDFCNLTRSDGGARALRRRMERPRADGGRIRATQQSIAFIIAERHAFGALPSAYTASRAERYVQEFVPVVSQADPVGFLVGALALRSGEDRHYIRIVTGLRFTREFIQALRCFVDQPAMDAAVGEIEPLLAEMRTLLDRPRLHRVQQARSEIWFWQVLALDRSLRIHEKSAIARLVELAGELDALVSMADVTRTSGFVMPHIEEGALRTHAEGLVHPYLTEAVGNPVELDQQRRLLFLTGPNMAGKTTYLRAVATALYLAHLGMGVPARHFSFVPAERLFSSISLHDDLHAGVSYFRAEALRVKAIARAVMEGHRVVALLDEPFKGTNVKDAFDASQAILERFACSDGCLFLFSSHLIELGERLRTLDRISYRYFEADESAGQLRFDYLLRPGISAQRLGMRVLEEEGIFELLGECSRPE